MFRWLTKQLNASASEDDPDTIKMAPGTTIPYSPELVAQLTTEHQQLSELFRDIQATATRGDYKKVVQKLNQFRSLLQGHLLIENVRLYIYLERVYADDTENYELIRETRKEMDGISRAALAFLDKYEGIGIDKDLEITFIRDMAEIGILMARRMASEERILCPLYAREH